MPITPTYPGVYIEELPSGVRTISGVATSIAAFLGYFSRGPMNEAVRVFNFGDFEREFGGLRADSEASYAIQQFFLNGGAEAYVVRVASVAPTAARLVLQDENGVGVLALEALEPGAEGNALTVEVDYAATDPTTQFNLSIRDGSTTETFSDLDIATAADVLNNDANWTEDRSVAATLVGAPTTRPKQTGTVSAQIDDPTASGLSDTDTVRAFLNGADQGTFDLSGPAIATVDGLRQRIQQRLQGLPSADLDAATVQNIDGRLRITAGRDEPDDVITLEDDSGSVAATIGLDTNDPGKPPPLENPEMFVLGGGHDGVPTAAAIDLQDAVGGSAILRLTAKGEGAWGNSLRVDVDHGVLDPNGDPDTLFNLTVSEVASVHGQEQVAREEVHTNLVIDDTSDRHVIDVLDGSDLVDVSLVGTPAAGTRPAQTGTVSPPFGAGAGEIDLSTLSLSGAETMRVELDGEVSEVAIGSPPFATASALASALQAAIRAAAPELERATVEVLGSGATRRFMRIKAGTGDPAHTLTFSDDPGESDTLAAALGLDDASRSNVQQYVLGASRAVGAQALPGGSPEVGHDGGPPGATDLTPDSEAGKEGVYALLDVDLFNILCIPDTVRLGDADAAVVASRATALCEAERAFYILDVPQPPNPVDEPAEMQEWLDENSGLRHRNAALYFPRPRIADPLNEFRLRPVAPSGTLAGVYARTDGERGVWKAPAGTEAVLRGVQALEYRLTDAENGTLNPLGVNALRTRPVVGNVAWGARTLVGADQLASEWKYIPIRRLALFIEESLFRGTQWVVFEPNDETLWSQIRLNVGTFMNTLFRQGAFQGTSPSDAYFVKCDAEVNPQADIDRGIVNIVVGFAPLKPAEFVIIKIQQMAGQLEA